ncbi:MAG: alpha/beta fold hydrolase [Polyangiales bacterium]
MGFKLLSWLLPEEAERRAAILFRTPRRPGASRAPVVPGLLPHHARVISDGNALPTWTFGQGPRAVLLVHGWSGHAAQMRALVKPLVERGFRVVTFDHPAHGAAEGTHATVLDMANAVRDVAIANGATTIFAHSLGATATALAIRRGLPVSRVAMYAPPAEVPPFLHALATALELPPAREQGLVSRVQAELGALDALDVRKLAPDFRARALIVHDPEDDEVPFAHGRGIAEAWPHAKLLALQGIGHRAGLRDQPMIEQVVDFLAEVKR